MCLVDSISQLLRKINRKTAILVYNEQFQECFSYQKEVPFCTASVIKLAIAQCIIDRKALDDETVQLIEKMICESENEAASILWQRCGAEKGMQSYFEKLGMHKTKAGVDGYWGLTETMASDCFLLWRYILQNKHPILRHFLTAIRADQQWGFSSCMNEHTTVYLKNGWSPKTESNWRMNATAYIENGVKGMGFIVLSEDNPTFEEGKTYIEALISELYTYRLP